MTNWRTFVDDFGDAVLQMLGEGAMYLPVEYNPVTRALDEDPHFIERIQDFKGFSKIALSRLAVACQMSVYDHADGPDGDGERKGLRRQWYAWYKTRFSIPASNQMAELGDEIESRGFDGILWNGRMSQTYSWFVDNGATYWDLWVTDASRMMESFYGELVRDLHVVIAVEKDSLFGDFKTAAKGIGAKCLVSGKGKQSRAATEKMLRDVFSIQWKSPFSAEHPLVVLHISDHDMDGEAVIGPTFAEQCRRYTPHVVEARVGISPDAFKVDGEFDEAAVQGSWYEVKTTNNGYLNWSNEKALFLAECPGCGHKWVIEGAQAECPQCWTETALTIKVKREIINQPMGFEVEALSTRQYYRLIVDALLRVVEFDWLVERLRAECVANHYEAADRVKDDILAANRDYQALLAEFDRLEEIKAEFENRLKNHLQDLAEPHVGDWADEEDDPEPEAFREYVGEMRNWDNAWRPFDQNIRTEKLTEWLSENGQTFEREDEWGEVETINWADAEIEW